MLTHKFKAYVSHPPTLRTSTMCNRIRRPAHTCSVRPPGVEGLPPCHRAVAAASGETPRQPGRWHPIVQQGTQPQGNRELARRGRWKKKDWCLDSFGKCFFRNWIIWEASLFWTANFFWGGGGQNQIECRRYREDQPFAACDAGRPCLILWIKAIRARPSLWKRRQNSPPKKSFGRWKRHLGSNCCMRLFNLTFGLKAEELLFASIQRVQKDFILASNFFLPVRGSVLDNPLNMLQVGRSLPSRGDSSPSGRERHHAWAWEFARGPGEGQGSRKEGASNSQCFTVYRCVSKSPFSPKNVWNRSWIERAFTTDVPYARLDPHNEPWNVRSCVCDSDLPWYS